MDWSADEAVVEASHMAPPETLEVELKGISGRAEIQNIDWRR